MNVSEQQSLQNIDVGSLGSVFKTQLGPTFLNNVASQASLQLPLISPEVIKLSAIRPNDDSQEQSFDDDSIGISQRETYGGSRRQPLDLHTLWRLLEHMDKEARRNGLSGGGGGRKNVGITSIDGEDITSNDDIGTHKSDDTLSGGGKMSTWELVVLQAVLLTLLIFISCLWAFCCKKKCLSDQPLMTEMVALARKISSGSSKDLPPSYSKVDLTQEGLTIDDHFNPPPNYDRAADLYNTEVEQKRLEAEGGGEHSEAIAPAHKFTPTLSFHQNRFGRINSGSSMSSLSRTSISSGVGQSTSESASYNRNPNTTCVVSIESNSSSFSQSDLPLHPPTKKTSAVSTASSISSNSSASRKISRVTFSPILEEGPTNRKDSSQSVPCKSVLISRANDEYRKRSAISEGGGGSRKVSFVFEDASSMAQGGFCKPNRVDPNPDLEKALNVQLELARQAGEMDDFISSSNNLNNEGVKSSPPMI